MGECIDALAWGLKRRHLTKHAQVCNEMGWGIEWVLPTWNYLVNYLQVEGGVSGHYIKIGRLLAFSTVVVLSLLLLVFRENSNKDRLRSLYFFFKKRLKLAFCRPVPYCAAEVLGEGSGLAVWAHCHRPPYLCFCSKPPLFSRLLSPWCVSSLESDL